MATDDKKDEDQPAEKQQLPVRQVVITHFGKKKKKEEEDVPAEIMPTSPSHILSSPVDVGAIASASGTAKEAPPSPQMPKTLEEKVIPRMPMHEAPLSSNAPEVTTSPPEVAQINFPEPEEFEAASVAHAREEEETPAFMREHPIPPPPPSMREQRGMAGTWALFLSLVTTIAVVALVYNAYNSQQELNDLQKITRDDKGSVQLLASQAKAALSQLEEIRDHNTNQQKVLSDLKDQLEGAQNQLVTLSGSNNWILSEANYLVFMANERLQTAHDIFSALAQLEAADQRLEALGPAYLWVREALAKDLAALRSKPQINRQALWDQVGLMRTGLQDLSFKSLEFTSAAPVVEKNAEPNPNWAPWRQALWRSWLEFKGLVRISKETDNAIPLALTAQEKAEVLRAGQLMAEQVQWAILEGNDVVYNQSLLKLKNWLATYFAANSAQATLITQIETLQQQQIQLAIPDISTSVHALSQALLDISGKSSNTSTKDHK